LAQRWNISGPFLFYENSVFFVESSQRFPGAPRSQNRNLQCEEEYMPMTRPQPINVLLVASVSAALHAATAVLFFPLLSFCMLCWGAAPVQFKGTIAAASDGMVFAVVAPLFFAAFGFFAGGLAALGHNVFAKDQRQRTLAISREPARARAASLGNVA
jgi:hypothetical protein